MASVGKGFQYIIREGEEDHYRYRSVARTKVKLDNDLNHNLTDKGLPNKSLEKQIHHIAPDYSSALICEKPDLKIFAVSFTDNLETGTVRIGTRGMIYTCGCVYEEDNTTHIFWTFHSELLASG